MEEGCERKQSVDSVENNEESASGESILPEKGKAIRIFPFCLLKI